MAVEARIELAGMGEPEPPARSSWRRSIAGTLGTGSALVAGQAATGLAMLVLARRSSPSHFGAFVALYGVTIAVAGIIDFGSSSRLTIRLAQGLDPGRVIPWLIRRTALQTPVVIVLTVAALAYTGDHLPRLCVVALCGQSLIWTICYGLLAAVRALRSPIKAEWMVFAGNVATLVTVIVCPSQHLLTATAIASFSSWAICAGIGALSLRRTILPRSRLHVGNPFQGAVSFGFASLATLIRGVMLIIVDRTAGSAAAGSLGAVQKWTQPVALIALAYSGYLFPSLAAAKSDRAALRMLRTVGLVFAVGCVLSIVVIVMAPFLIRGLLGPEYIGSVHVLRLLIVASMPDLIIGPLATFLQARGAHRLVARLAMPSAILSLVVVALFASRVGNAIVPIVEGAGNVVALTVFGFAARNLWRGQKPKAWDNS